jgi:HEPN domain-containing protein
LVSIQRESTAYSTNGSLLKQTVRWLEEFQSLKEGLQELDRYAVVVRYPGVLIKAETAESALKAAAAIRKFMRRKLKLK